MCHGMQVRKTSKDLQAGGSAFARLTPMASGDDVMSYVLPRDCVGEQVRAREIERAS